MRKAKIEICRAPMKTEPLKLFTKESNIGRSDPSEVRVVCLSLCASITSCYSERTASLSPRYGASRLSLRPSFRALSSPAQVPDVNCASDVTHQFKSDSNTPGFGALIKCWSNICKILLDCLTGTRLYQPAHALRPLDRLIFHANALPVRLLLWFASNDTAYLHGGRNIIGIRSAPLYVHSADPKELHYKHTLLFPSSYPSYRG
eukprot:scaffold9430_cov128-Isochrysis_galbana.AAC.7